MPEGPRLFEAYLATTDTAELAVRVSEVTRVLPLSPTSVTAALFVDLLRRRSGHQKDRIILIEGELARPNLKLAATLHYRPHARAVARPVGLSQQVRVLTRHILILLVDVHTRLERVIKVIL